MRILLKSGRLIDPSINLDEENDLYIENGKIQEIAPPNQLKLEGDFQTFDCKNKIVSPGLVDIHVHLREPGQEWKETIYTGSEAAVAGGFTDICCMPNTKPVNDTAAVSDFIVSQGLKSLCRVHPIGAITKGSKGESLAPYGELSDAGCVAFSDDGRPVMNAQIMRRALEYCSMLGRVLAVHEEDLNLSDGFAMNESALSLQMGLKGMPDAAENVMIARDIELARLTKGRVHFCHVSTHRGVQLIRRAKEDGILVTAEVAPHHLYLTEKSVEGFDTQAKMSMPLRGEQDIHSLIEGLKDGTIDCIASDHAPHETDSKNIEFDRASFGMLGLQTTVPIMFDLVRKGQVTQYKMIESLTSKAWKCYDLNSGTLKKGNDATISILDPNLEFRYTPETNKSKSINTPFMNQSFLGSAYMTIISGIIRYKSEGLN